MNANTLRRLNWLWKHRHNHDGDTTLQQIEVIRTIVESNDDKFVTPSGQCIHVTTTDSIPDNATTAVTFNAFVGQTTHGFSSTRNAIPTTDLIAPFSAVSQVSLRVTWDDVAAGGWLGDGVVASLKVNGAVVDQWVADDPALFPVAPLIADSVKLPVTVGDILTLELYQNSGQARNVTVEMSWGLEDQNQRVSGAPVDAMTAQARVWLDGTSEPSTWHINASVSPLSADLYAALVVGNLSDNGLRRCDWVGWGPTGTAPVDGEAGIFTDFCEVGHTLGQPPDGWTQIIGTNRIVVDTYAGSNSSCGRSAVTANWSSGNDRGLSLWTDQTAANPTSGAVEVTAVLQGSDTSGTRHPPAIGAVSLADEGWHVQQNTSTDQLELFQRGAGVIATGSVSLTLGNWYRVRLRITPGG